MALTVEQLNLPEIERTLRDAAAARGVSFDQSDLEGIIRNTTYSVGGVSLETAIANAVHNYDVRAAPTGHRTVDSQSAEGQRLYGTGADLTVTQLPFTMPALPTIMLSRPATAPGTTLLPGELTATSLPTRGMADSVSMFPSMYSPGNGGFAAGTLPMTQAPGVPTWVWIVGAGAVAYMLWKR